MIKAQIVADSLSPSGDRLVSVLCTFPRIILAEVNTHRMLSKNTASSRAIPFFKMLQSLYDNPFIPIAWQTHHSGMQGSEYVSVNSVISVSQYATDFISLIRNQADQDKFTITEEFEVVLNQLAGNFLRIFAGYGDLTIIDFWLKTRDIISTCATMLYTYGKVSKQICNRLLEPFMWTTMLITGPLEEGWDNFFSLRCPNYEYEIDGFGIQSFKSKINVINAIHEDDIAKFDCLDIVGWLQFNKGMAEIHMMALAECIWDAFNESVPNKLNSGEWHIPFDNNIDELEVAKHIIFPKDLSRQRDRDLLDFNKVKVSTGMAAQTSYTVIGVEKGINYTNLISLHDRLIKQEPPHSSPMEHCALVMTHEQYYSNIKGEAPYITTLGNNNFDELYNGTNHKVFGWCRNFKGFIPYRYIVENNGK